MCIRDRFEGDLDTRNHVYKELISLNNYDMSYDWFQEMYESELSERKDVYKRQIYNYINF